MAGAVNAALSRVCERFWFRPAGPAGLIAARSIVCAHALWILLSRPDLPGILEWPKALWRGADAAVAARFLIFGLPASVERVFFALLIVGLAAGAVGFFRPVPGFALAVLLYHFAPFEDIFASRGGPFFRGLTIPVLALVLLASARAPDRRAEPSADFRWPLASIQLLVAFTYLSSGLTKLLAVGPRWFTAGNFQGLVLGLILPEISPPWARWVAERPALCGVGAVLAFALDFLLPASLLSPRLARFAVPILACAHLVIVQTLGVYFLGAPLLLVCLDWDSILALRRARPEIGTPEMGTGRRLSAEAEPAPPRSPGP
jgi:hypothetical protein